MDGSNGRHDVMYLLANTGTSIRAISAVGIVLKSKGCPWRNLNEVLQTLW